MPLTAAATDGAGQHSGLAAGLFNTTQQAGNAVALAVLATVAAAILCLLGLLAALRLPRRALTAPTVGGGRPGPARRRTRSPRDRAAR